MHSHRRRPRPYRAHRSRLAGRGVPALRHRLRRRRPDRRGGARAGPRGHCMGNRSVRRDGTVAGGRRSVPVARLAAGQDAPGNTAVQRHGRGLPARVACPGRHVCPRRGRRDSAGGPDRPAEPARRVQRVARTRRGRRSRAHGARSHGGSRATRPGLRRHRLVLACRTPGRAWRRLALCRRRHPLPHVPGHRAPGAPRATLGASARRQRSAPCWALRWRLSGSCCWELPRRRRLSDLRRRDTHRARSGRSSGQCRSGCSAGP